MAATETEIEEFLTGPLVTWLSTCVKKPETLQIFETFFDGSPISEVLLQIDPEPSQPIPNSANLQGLSVTASRIKIFHCINKSIKSIYEDELGQIVVSLPDCVTLGRAPASQTALQQLQLLLLLLLGCAVQGPTKEIFIARIKELSVDSQHSIVECIKQITDDQCVVLTQDWQEQAPERLYMHLRGLITVRDNLLQQWVTDIGQENLNNTASEGVESNHLAVELADWKARFRKQRQELEEKTELLTEYKEELEHVNAIITKLKVENGDLLAEARRAKSYRDEVDAMREKADRADRLENEAQRYRERLADAEFYKVRVDELREDNRVLIETREMLESQLSRARQRADHLLELEADLLNCKQKINDVALERDAAREKILELNHENFQLQQVTKSALQETSLANIVVDSDNEEESYSGDNSISEQLTNNAQTRALKLELENRKLMSAMDSLKENNFQETSKKILELENDKKKLTLKCEQLQNTCERWTQQNSELEILFKNALQENRKLQDSMDTSKVISDRQNQELQNERVKITDLEKSIETLAKEKQRVQSLCDSIKKRADDSERSLTQVMDQVDVLQTQAEQCKELENIRNNLLGKVAALEKEGNSMQKEITKQKECVEAKELLLDLNTEKCGKQLKDLAELNKEKEILTKQLEKLHDCETKSQELLSQAAVYTETVSTLQKDLVVEKLNNERCKTNLEKLGLSLDVLDNDINIVVEQILCHPEITKNITSVLKEKQLLQDEIKCMKCTENKETLDTGLANQELEEQCAKLSAEISILQHQNDSLQAVNAKMQVDISTITSQVNSLTAQQTALQLANSQLVAEKEEMSKQQKIQNNQHDTLLNDQVTIRSLHEQLGAEYEDLKNDQENWKKLNRDLRTEIRNMKDLNVNLEKRIITIEHEKDALKNESKSLGNLRAEHSKLKDDFRNLLTAHERLKSDYRIFQDEYKTVKTESSRLKLGHTEMQGELNSRSDLVAVLQLDNAKLQQKCDMLFDMNHSLDNDRRKLMDHVSQLLAQYHSLLTHSLEDKEHYHVEEKLFTDKLNNLCRQKEKLEEKIMEHYRKLDNASAKKKGFGATLVRRVRKAGSDIINKVPSRNRRSWQEDLRLTQSQVTLAGCSGESGGNDSDNSTEDALHRSESFKRSVGSLHGHKHKDEVTLRRSQRDNASHRSSIAGDQVYSRDTTGSALSLGSVGTRRTVYLSEDDPTTPTPPINPPVPPLLVYNRISTVIGGGETNRNSAQAASNAPEEPVRDNGERKKDATKENAIWYEYGCV